MKKVLIVCDKESFLSEGEAERSINSHRRAAIACLSIKGGVKPTDKPQVVLAGNAQQAIEVLRASPFDFLVADLKLPAMGGFELIAWLSHNQSQLPVMVMTTSGSKRHIRRVTLSTFLQLINIEKINCTLKISSANEVAHLFISQGELIDAEYKNLESEAAALQVVGWDSAEIEIEYVCNRQQKMIELSLEEVLIRGGRDKRRKLRTERVDEEQMQPIQSGTVSFGRLVEILSKLAAVQEYVVLDQNNFLKGKNSGHCSIENFEPAIYFNLVKMLNSQLSFGSFNFLAINTASRARFFLFPSQQHRVLVKLAPGTLPQPVFREIQHYVNT